MFFFILFLFFYFGWLRHIYWFFVVNFLNCVNTDVVEVFALIIFWIFKVNLLIRIKAWVGFAARLINFKLFQKCKLPLSFTSFFIFEIFFLFVFESFVFLNLKLMLDLFRDFEPIRICNSPYSWNFKVVLIFDWIHNQIEIFSFWPISTILYNLSQLLYFFRINFLLFFNKVNLIFVVVFFVLHLLNKLIFHFIGF